MITNKITKNLLKDFLQSQGITSTDNSQDQDFENFVNYSIISHEYNGDFELEDISIGAGLDTGIDGLAIIVNGQVIDSIEEVDLLIKNNNYLEITYIFIQSKTSPSFDSGRMHTFGYGVKDFFNETPSLPRNEDVKYMAEISNYLFEQAKYFRHNPICKLFYVTTGVWNDNDQNLLAVKNSTISALESTSLFSRINYSIYGADEINKCYLKTRNSITATFVFAEKITLPELHGINEGYYGVLPFSEFKKILVDENGNLRNIFYDNVRDFQGISNSINKTIKETISSDTPDLFTVLNNGITLVASKLQTSGNRFTLQDYQIVNGCQTSNVLYHYINNLALDNLRIPIKLIVTDDDEVKNKITLATNSQTAIKREELRAMTEFQKNLEHYYNATDNNWPRLYYERRAKQYQSDNSISKIKIISIQVQIKAFGSMFLRIPHLVTSYFGSVVKNSIEDKPDIFDSEHQFIPYYTASVAYYRLDSLFNTKQIDTKYRKVKYFLLMLFGLLASNESLKNANLKSLKQSNNLCIPIIEILNDEKKYLPIYQKAISLFEESGIQPSDKQFLKQQAATDKILSTYYQQKP